MPEEVLVPGALYADCAVVVNLMVKLDNNAHIQPQVNDEVTSKTKTSMNGEERGREAIELPDDGKYGGELAGRLVWEAYEAGLKVWEKENPRPVEEERSAEDRKKESGSTRDTEIRTQIVQKNEKDDVDVYL